MFGRTRPLINPNPPPDIRTEPLYHELFFSNLDIKYRVLQEIMTLIETEKCLTDESRKVHVRVALDEALVNAVRHGNGDDQNKRVEVTIWKEATGCRFRITDQGAGFAESDIPDLENPDNMLLDHGRGIAYMHAFFNDVQFYSGGRTLELFLNA